MDASHNVRFMRTVRSVLQEIFKPTLKKGSLLPLSRQENWTYGEMARKGRCHVPRRVANGVTAVSGQEQ